MNPAPPVTSHVFFTPPRSVPPRGLARDRVRRYDRPVAARFDLEKFLVDVFAPVAGERAAVLTDVPTAASPDNPAWAQRRGMAASWRDGLARLGEKTGFEVRPLVTYPATGRSGASFPADIDALFDEVSLVLAFAEFSPTAALVDVCKRRPGAAAFRAASMPGIEKRMEETSLAA